MAALESIMNAKSGDRLNEIFWFLDGGRIIHKIAILNKHVRNILQKPGPHCDSRVVTLIAKARRCYKWPKTKGDLV